MGKRFGRIAADPEFNVKKYGQTERLRIAKL